VKGSAHKANLAVYVLLLGAVVPYAYIDTWRISGLPGVNYIACIAAFACAALMGRKSLGSLLLLVAFALYAYMAIEGALSRAEERWTLKLYLTDLLYSGMFLAGLVFGIESQPKDQVRVMAQSFVISTVGLIGITGALAVGFLPSVGSAGRVFDPSQYILHYWQLSTATYFIEFYKERRYLRMAIGIPALLIAFIFPLYSVTRSSFLFASSLVACLLLTQAKGSGKAVVLGLFLIALPLFTLGDGVEFIKGLGLLGERFSSESLTADMRYTETLALLEQLGGNYLGGRGFGYAFYTPVVIKGEGFEELGVTPHIGLISFLYKGGILVWLPFMAALIIAITLSILRSGADRYSAIVLGPLCLYAIVGSMSGGYGIYYMFMLGVVLATVLSHSRQPEFKRRRHILSWRQKDR